MVAAAPDGDTALHLAARHGAVQIVPQLLEAAPEAALAKDSIGCTPFMVALRRGDFNLAMRLLFMAPPPPPAEVLPALASAAARAPPPGAVPDPGAHAWVTPVHMLYAVLAARQALTAGEWALVPAPCLHLGAALPVILQRSPG